MTCIVGIEYKEKGTEKVLFGCDSLGSDGQTQDDYDNKKIVVVGDFLLGFTGSYRLLQILEHCFAPVAKPEGMEDMEYLVTIIIPTIRSAFHDQGFVVVSEDKIGESSEAFDGEFLLSYHGKIYLVQCDYSILRSKHGVAAVGSGETAAKGALFSVHDSNLKPKERALLALEAAERYCVGVRRPFYFLTL